MILKNTAKDFINVSFKLFSDDKTIVAKCEPIRSRIS